MPSSMQARTHLLGGPVLLSMTVAGSRACCATCGGVLTLHLHIPNTPPQSPPSLRLTGSSNPSHYPTLLAKFSGTRPITAIHFLFLNFSYVLCALYKLGRAVTYITSHTQKHLSSHRNTCVSFWNCSCIQAYKHMHTHRRGGRLNY